MKLFADRTTGLHGRERLMAVLGTHPANVSSRELEETLFASTVMADRSGRAKIRRANDILQDIACDQVGHCLPGLWYTKTRNPNKMIPTYLTDVYSTSQHERNEARKKAAKEAKLASIAAKTGTKHTLAPVVGQNYVDEPEEIYARHHTYIRFEQSSNSDDASCSGSDVDDNIPTVYTGRWE